MDQAQVILYVRGITDATDLARAQEAIGRADGIVAVAEHLIPSQDGSEALAKQILVTYRTDATTPELMVTELVDAGFGVVLEEVPGTTETEVNPLLALKTTAEVTRDYHAEESGPLPQTQDIVQERPSPRADFGGTNDVTRPYSPLGQSL